MTRRTGRALQMAMAAGGGVIGSAGVIGALGGEGPAPPDVLRLFAAWCVLTPYWRYLEHRLLRPSDPAELAEFTARQSLSRLVWLGFALAMGVPILARAP